MVKWSLQWRNEHIHHLAVILQLSGKNVYNILSKFLPCSSITIVPMLYFRSLDILHMCTCVPLVFCLSLSISYSQISSLVAPCVQKTKIDRRPKTSTCTKNTVNEFFLWLRQLSWGIVSVIYFMKRQRGTGNVFGFLQSMWTHVKFHHVSLWIYFGYEEKETELSSG